MVVAQTSPDPTKQDDADLIACVCIFSHCYPQSLIRNLNRFMFEALSVSRVSYSCRLRANGAILQGAAHHIGTASMAPRAIGGVVDGTLKVYGTTNLRVVDASIIPNQLAAHTQATVYAIAEKAGGLTVVFRACADICYCRRR